MSANGYVAQAVGGHNDCACPEASGHRVRSRPQRGLQPQTICPQNIFGIGHNVQVWPQKTPDGKLRTQKETSGPDGVFKQSLLESS